MYETEEMRKMNIIRKNMNNYIFNRENVEQRINIHE